MPQGTTRRIWRDISNPTILVGCHECREWYALRLDRVAAYEAGAVHEIDVHGQKESDAYAALDMYLERAGLPARVKLALT